MAVKRFAGLPVAGHDPVLRKHGDFARLLPEPRAAPDLERRGVQPDHVAAERPGDDAQALVRVEIEADLLPKNRTLVRL